MENTSELEVQKQIYNLIVKEPGLHLNKIAQLLNVDRPLVIYHLHYLEKHDLITIDKQKGYTRCYTKGTIGVEDQRKLSILRQHICCKIVIYLLKNPNAKHKEILENFDIAKSTLSYHLKKLTKNGIIMALEGSTDQGYVVVDEKGIIAFLVRYKPLRIAVGMNETWEDFSIRKPRIEK